MTIKPAMDAPSIPAPPILLRRPRPFVKGRGFVSSVELQLFRHHAEGLELCLMSGTPVMT